MQPAELDTHPVLVDDVDDDDQPAVVLAVVHQGHPPDLDEPLERLHARETPSGQSKHASLKPAGIERGDHSMYHLCGGRRKRGGDDEGTGG